MKSKIKYFDKNIFRKSEIVKKVCNILKELILPSVVEISDSDL